VKVNWLKAPADREVIARWTARDSGSAYALALPAPPDPERFEFLVVGDTGDSDVSSAGQSPQEAVAQHLAGDASLPESPGPGAFLLHMGDVVYMAGERRLYDRNFRRPYSSFLTPGSTVDDLVFRLPFLPVPGNHDYYDFAGWASTLVRIPGLGSGLKALARELFAYNIPQGGSGMGRTYMEAFVERGDGHAGPLDYRPGEHTRIPNRYYRFRYGGADFFALDSNTLEAPPRSAEQARARADATRRVRDLEARASRLNHELTRDQQALERWAAGQRARLTEDPARLARVADAAHGVEAALRQLQAAQRLVVTGPLDAGAAAREAGALADRWSAATADLARASKAARADLALSRMDGAAEASVALLRSVEGALAELPEGVLRTDLLAAQEAVEAALRQWREAAESTPPEELCGRIRQRSEAALDAQRALARERRRMSYRPEDHDEAQLRWLDAALSEAERERPGGWRIVYLHHPLYSTIGNHCEGGDIQGVRDNLLSLLRGRVHLILGGHSHAFEWIRSGALPHTGLFVTGGGGQVSLRRSVLDPRRFLRYRDRYDALRRAEVVECCFSGAGPAAADGEDGPIYHYLRIEVTPDRLLVRPIGVRRLARGFRREAPMPVHHVPELGNAGGQPPGWYERRLVGVEIRRDRAPRPVWD